MRAGVRVRAAAGGDVDELVHLSDDAHASTVRTRAPFDRRARYQQLLADDERIVLVAQDEHTGRLLGVLAAGEGEVGAMAPMPALVINHLIVDVAHRRRGIGRALLTAAVRACDERGLDHVVVSVATGDRAANRYLARLGFGPLVVRRIASTTVLRRSLGLTEGVTRAGRRGRALRSVALPRTVTRGA